MTFPGIDLFTILDNKPEDFKSPINADTLPIRMPSTYNNINAFAAEFDRVTAHLQHTDGTGFDSTACTVDVSKMLKTDGGKFGNKATWGKMQALTETNAHLAVFGTGPRAAGKVTPNGRWVTLRERCRACGFSEESFSMMEATMSDTQIQMALGNTIAVPVMSFLLEKLLMYVQKCIVLDPSNELFTYQIANKFTNEGAERAAKKRRRFSKSQL